MLNNQKRIGMQVKFPVVTVLIFVWVGFICAISFLEAPLKFQAPGGTLPLGVGIGRLVFTYVNKMEWVFATIIICTVFPFTTLSENSNPKRQLRLFFLFLIPFSILLIQSIWLLPVLDERASLIARGIILFPSRIHYCYVIAELIKVLSLFSFGLLQFI